MFCIHCGKQLLDCDAFCTACGAKNENFVQTAVSEEPPAVKAVEQFGEAEKTAAVVTELPEPPVSEEVFSEEAAPKKRIPSLRIVMLASAFLVLAAGVTFALFALFPNAVSLAKHSTLTYAGYSGYGRAEAAVSDTLLEALSEQSKAAPEELERLADSVVCTLSKTEKIENGDVLEVTFQYDRMLAETLDIKLADHPLEQKVGGLETLTPYNPFDQVTLTFQGYDELGIADAVGEAAVPSLTYLVKNSGTLKNGEDAIVTVQFDEAEAIDAGILIQPLEKTYPVSGLESLSIETLFQDLDIAFSGKSPNLKAQVKSTQSLPGFGGITYKADPSEGLSEGDTVTIHAVLPKRENQPHATEFIAPEAVVVAPTDEPLTEYNQLSSEQQATLEAAAEALIDQYVEEYKTGEKTALWQPRGIYGAMIPDNTQVQGALKTLDSVYVLSPKSGEGENQVLFLYEAALEYDDQPIEEWYSVRSYFVITFDGLMLQKNAEADLRIDTGKVYRTVDPDSYSLYDVYEGVIESHMDSFHIDETIVSEEHSARMNEVKEFPVGNIEGFGILFYSSDRYLLPADIRGLTVDEIQMAINEIYARHGYIFGDTEIQTHVENNVRGYTPVMKGGNFDDSLFTEIESYNVDFLAASRSGAPSAPPEGSSSGSSLADFVGTWTTDVEKTLAANDISIRSFFGSIYTEGTLTISEEGDLHYFAGVYGGTGICTFEDGWIYSDTESFQGPPVYLKLKVEGENLIWAVTSDDPPYLFYWKRA